MIGSLECASQRRDAMQHRTCRGDRDRRWKGAQP
jgi:hypothetical protein